MILRKDPIVKKIFIVFTVTIIAFGIAMIFNNYFFIEELGDNGVKISAVYGFMVKSIIIVVLMIVISISSFIYVLKRIIGELDKISFEIDRIMDGDFSAVSDTNEEGILSRIEFQFFQMSKRLQINLNEINDEKENVKSLVTDISHQLRTPLSSIKVFNSLLLENGISKEEEEEFLNRIKNEEDKLEWLLNSLTKISMMETGLIQLKKKKDNIKSTIIEAVNGIYLKASEKGIDIKMNNLQDIYICHDAKWTKEAIFNVLENAVKYTDENGEIDISIEKLESYIKIDIDDNGIGIPSKDIRKIFDRFYRGNSERVRKTQGSGVGLYLTRKILEEQGGSITAFSKEGQGSEFTILMVL